MNPENGTKSLKQLLEASHAADQEARAFIGLLEKTGRKSSHLAIAYRCKKRCTLFEVYRVPGGLIFRQPRYRLSPLENLRGSSEAGRKKNTLDGNRRWKEQVGDLVDGVRHEVNCDHVLKFPLAADDVLNDIEEGAREVTLPR
ncbi:hypothetical protein ACUXOQ_001820 [Dermabacter hominis]